MKEFLYPTWVHSDDAWVRRMLTNWRDSGKPYLCFPWIKFHVHTLPDKAFWMYFYYAITLTDIRRLQKMIEFRVRVLDWSEEKFVDTDIFLARGEEDGTAWFKCDKYEEIRKNNKTYVSVDDFQHAFGKKLGSTLRNSIPQVKCQSKISVFESYP